MRRRLIIAMVGTALAAVVFVGAGVLALAQIGARADTEDRVADGLEALSDLADRTGNVETIRELERTRVAFGLDELAVVVVEGDQLLRVTNVGNPRRGQAPFREREAVGRLDPGQLDAFASGQVVFIDDRGRNGASRVIGIRALSLDGPGGGETTVGLIAARQVVTVADEARAWFVLSALTVVALAGVGALVLARRIIRPLTAIEQATASIAAGDFAVRVRAEGDDELAQLGHSVNRMATDLERSKALDQQFLMSVSHDLRTPLTAISGYAEALRDGAVTDPTQAGEVIGNQADRLERLVGDLLDLARLDANRFTLDRRQVDAAVIVGRAVAGQAHRAEELGLTLRATPSGPLPVVADPDRLAQCVENLVDNALKFATTEVAVTTDRDDRDVRVVVADDGPGIDDADLPHVFERLYTGSNRPDRSENSTGMGLAIVRELMAAMGGSVSIRSEVGTGTSLVLRLPAVS